MEKTWLVADTLITPLGNSSEENFNALQQGRSGVQKIQYGTERLPLSFIEDFKPKENHTRFDSLCLAVLKNCIDKVNIDKDKTLLLLSTTKGNIELIGKSHNDERLQLSYSANLLKEHFGLKEAVVVSNACISGVMAMIMAKRMLSSNQYENVIVLGADVLTPFVVKGFQSVHALSDTFCKPFDEARNGINLGEAAAALILTNHPERIGAKAEIALLGGSISNDANHISGPSRTGMELASAISNAMHEAQLSSDEIGFISAHGTATVYNDEMEAKAIHHAGLQDIPVHSLKGYFGHTLGAAGVVETIMCMQSLKQQEPIVSRGYENSGVSQPLNIITHREKKELNSCVKTASGFGGGNAAVVLKRN